MCDTYDERRIYMTGIVSKEFVNGGKEINSSLTLLRILFEFRKNCQGYDIGIEISIDQVLLESQHFWP